MTHAFVSRDMRKHSIRLKSIIALHIFILLSRVKASEILIADQTFQSQLNCRLLSCQVPVSQSLTVATDANQGVIYKTQPDQIDSISLTLCLCCVVSVYFSYTSKQIAFVQFISPSKLLLS